MATLTETSTGSRDRLLSIFRGPAVVCVVACVVFLLAVAATRTAAVVGHLPYCQHKDEAYLTRNAVHILQTLDLNPHFFRYPSLPIYMVAMFMRLTDMVVHRQAPVDNWIVPSLPGGYYDPASIYSVPRIAFALFSTVTLACSGKIASSLFKSPVPLLFAPVVLASSLVFQHSSVRYLNVDGPTAMFATCTVLATLLAWERDDFWYKSVFPGVLAGLTIACKYNSGLVLIPAGLGILFGSRSRRIEKVIVLAVSAAVVFVICVPYSVLDTARFFKDIRFEMHHYRTGHWHFDAEPGWPQLAFYSRLLRDDLGAVTMLLSVVGLVYGMIRDPRRTAAVASFPIAMLAHMSTNRVHFPRTVLPVFVLVPVFAAGGIVAVAEAVQRAIARAKSARFTTDSGAASSASVWLQLALALPCIGCTATSALFDRNLAPDSRHVVSEWLTDHASGTDVFFAPETTLAPDTVRGMRVHFTAFAMTDLESLLAKAPSATCYVAAPTYGTKTGRKVNDRISYALAERHGEVVLSGQGHHVVAWSSDGPQQPTEDAALTLYRVGCGQRDAH